MTELDPYAILGVPRGASREEIARAYRALAKEHHPDRGAPPNAAMARINESWHVLSDPGRRARWDRAHTIAVPPHWAAAPEQPMRRPAPIPQAPPSPMDSGWVAIGIVAAVGVLVAAVMIGVSAAAQPPDDRLRFASDEISFAYPSDWVLTAGDGTESAGGRVVAHLVTFAVGPTQWCTNLATPCELTGEAVPPGEASVVITAWEGGPPPVPDPVVSRPFGKDADAIIGGQPAAFEVRSGEDGVVAWWQLSSPGFPDRWIEVLAHISGQELEQEEMTAALGAVLDTVEFPAGS